MPKTIDAFIDPAILEEIERAWCELVTDEWIELNKPASQHHHEKKGFTRDNLLSLARIARRGEDGLGNDEAAQAFLLRAHIREFGYTVSFLNHVREILSKDLGYVKNKATGLRERPMSRNGRWIVNAAFFLHLRKSRYLTPVFKVWCDRKNIRTGNQVFAEFLEETGRWIVDEGVVRRGGRGTRK